MSMGALARWWHFDEGAVTCDLCPHRCSLRNEGARGICGLRYRSGDALWTKGWESVASIHLDPIEKKPLYHFLPGSITYSLGMVGCNLGCVFCQNWSLSAERGNMEMPYAITPAQIVESALAQGARSVSFTYNEPLIAAEFWIEVAKECHQHGLKTIAVTNGYANPECCKEFFAHMDAANVDLKSFSEAFHQKVCMGHLEPVLHTLETIRALGSCHLELTTLLIPSQNDTESELVDLSRWVAKHFGKDTPVHFSAFHPDYRAMDWEPTTRVAVARACGIARTEGLRHVYSGNVHDPAGSRTLCPECGKVLIERSGMHCESNVLKGGGCPECGLMLPGVWSS